MEYLYVIIDALLQQNGFENAKEIDDILQKWGCLRFYASTEDAPEQYLLIENFKLSEIPSEEEFFKLQSELFNLLAEHVDKPGFSKNVSYLLAIDSGNGEDLNDGFEKYVLKIEEDPYYFKKLVLPYDSKTAEAIVSECEQSSQGIVAYFQKQINDISNFTSFVEGKNTIYKLISQLYIKMPFVALQLKSIEGANSLAAELSQIIEEKQLTSLWEKVSEFESEDYNKFSIHTDMKELDKLLITLDTQEEK